MQRIAQFWKSGIKGKFVIGCSSLLALFCACSLLGVLVGPSDSTQQGDDGRAKATSMSEPTDTSRPTITPRPANTQRPTSIPNPTDTVQPTNTPEPTSTPNPTDTLQPTSTPEPTNTPRPTDTLTPTPLPQPTATPVPATQQPLSPTATPTEPPQPTEPPAPTGPSIHIVAVDKGAEFVDIRNDGDQAQDLGGWVLVSVKGDQKCGLGGILPPGETLRIWARAADAGQGGYNCGFDKTIWNNDESDPAELYNNAGQLVDRYP